MKTYKKLQESYTKKNTEFLRYMKSKDTDIPYHEFEDAIDDGETYAYMDLENPKLLKRTTWLVHFSENAHSISYEGFKGGMRYFYNIGLTKHISRKHFFRSPDRDGYFFAFVADSRYASRAAKKTILWKRWCVFSKFWNTSLSLWRRRKSSCFLGA